jgi:energy-coupling factor transporter transmembrane protein EcfT
MSYDTFLIAAPLIIGYLVSYALYRRNTIRIRLHTRIWNIIFLISFLLVMSMGILQVGLLDMDIYIPQGSELNFWHQMVGIAFTIILFIHFMEYRSFFRRLLEGKGKR